MRGDFFARFLQGGALSLVKLITGLIKIKVIATLLGVKGVGVLSLALQFQAAAVAIVSMSLAVGVINLGRPSWADGKLECSGAIVGTAFGMVGINSVIFLCLFFLYQDFFIGFFFGSLDINLVFWPIAIAAVVMSFANAIGEGVLFLFDRFDLYVRVNIIASLIDVLLFATGAWLFGLQGALFAALASGAVLIFTYGIIAYRLNCTHDLLEHLSCAVEWIRPLSSYCMLMIGTTGIGLAVLFVARSQIVAIVGAEANGYLQVVTALAAYLLPFIMNGVWGHLHPYVAALGDCEKSRNELKRTLLATVRLSVAGSVAVVLIAPVLVPLAYTQQFLGSLPYISIYFVGEMLFIFISVFGAYLLSTGLKMPYFVGYLGYHIILLVGVFSGVENYGIWAYVGAHLLAALIISITVGFYSVKRHQLMILDIVKVALWVVPGGVVCLLAFLTSRIELFGNQINVSLYLGSVLIALALGPYLIKIIRKDWA